MMTGAMGRLALRLACVAALTGLTMACASPQSAAPVAPAGYGKDDISRAERLVQYCDRLAEKGEMVTALGLCARAHDIDPDNPETLMKVASILQSLDRDQAAAQTLGLLLERHPGHQEARYSLGKLYMESGEQSLAMMHFNQAIASNPEDPRPYNALGILRDQAGEHQEAQDMYRSALKRDPKNLSARNNLGLSLALSGQRDEAIEILAELAVDPEADRTVLRNLEAAYAARAVPANVDSGPGEAAAMEAEPAITAPLGEPAMTAPVGDLPKAVDPVEVEVMDKRPAQPSPMPRTAPPAAAPTVEAVPAKPATGMPTPLYIPKPSFSREAPPSGFESRFGRSPSASSSFTASRPAPAPRKPARAAGEPSSTILAAAEQLMQPPAWADFDPGHRPATVPQEAKVEPAPASQSAMDPPHSAEPAPESKSDASTFNSMAKRSVFSST